MTEHMILDCDNYAYLQWVILQDVLSCYLSNLLLMTHMTMVETGRSSSLEAGIKVTLTYQNNIYHKQIPQIRTYRVDIYICTRDIFNKNALASMMASIRHLSQAHLLEVVSLKSWANTALIQGLSSSLVLQVVLFVSLSNAPLT